MRANPRRRTLGAAMAAPTLTDPIASAAAPDGCAEPESASRCPYTLQQIFGSLRQDSIKRFPALPNFEYIGVSSFIFLRFFNAAILVRRLVSPVGLKRARAAPTRKLTAARGVLSHNDGRPTMAGTQAVRPVPGAS